jgi:hypothetical protein
MKITINQNQIEKCPTLSGLQAELLQAQLADLAQNAPVEVTADDVQDFLHELDNGRSPNLWAICQNNLTGSEQFCRYQIDARRETVRFSYVWAAKSRLTMKEKRLLKAAKALGAEIVGTQPVDYQIMIGLGELESRAVLRGVKVVSGEAKLSAAGQRKAVEIAALNNKLRQFMGWPQK